MSRQYATHSLKSAYWQKGQSTTQQPFGFLAIDKPAGMTSHDVVANVRRGTGIKRIGHAGTLDPMATGALLLCIGAATRLSEYVMSSDKVYRAVVRLGIETDTYDADGKIIAVQDAGALTHEAVKAALSQFQGEIDQIPPMYSAIKQAGQKLYELARQGKAVERMPRRVRLRVVIESMALPDLTLCVTCSAGTYIRSLAHDLGAALGVGAHLTVLRRLASGTFSEGRGDLVDWEILLGSLADRTWRRFLVDERRALPHIPELALDEQGADDVLHGRVLSGASVAGDLCRAYDPAGRFIAILEHRDDVWKPAKVFLPDPL